MFANLEEQVSDLHSNPDKCTLNVPKAVRQPRLLPFLIPRAFSRFNADFVFVTARSPALITHGCHQTGRIDAVIPTTLKALLITVSLASSLPPFLAATRCRVPHVRRQTLSLLHQIDCVGGIWNSNPQPGLLSKSC